MKALKFAKTNVEKPKDPNWFKNLNTKTDQPKSTLKCGLTEEDERKIQAEMIPHYIAKQ